MKQVLITVGCIFFIFASFAQAGTLDKSFGNDGVVLGKPFFHTVAAFLEPDGKILITGDDENGAGLIRYLTYGNLDIAFGDKGIALVKGFAPEIFLQLRSICLQPDNKIVVGGSADSQGLIIRYKPDGSVDSSFGSNGIVLIAEGGQVQSINGIAIQPDGKIVGAGIFAATFESSQYIQVIRFNTDGSLDKSFGTGGRTVNAPDRNSYRGVSVVLQPDGKIVTGGYRFTGKSEFFVSRYNNDGSMDESFGYGGNVRTAFSDNDEPNDQLNALALQPDGKILATGYSYNSQGDWQQHMAAARYMSDGTMDKTFGTEGKAIVKFDKKSSGSKSVLLQKDAKIILTGSTYSHPSLDGADYALCRLLQDGTIDSSFGENGRQTTDLGEYENCINGLLVENDKILLVGNTDDEVSGIDTSLLIRYNGDNTKQPLAVRIKRWLLHHGISWQVQQSKDVRYYAVQRSADNIVYKEIAKLSNKTQVDKYEDATTITGSSYYRLAAIGWDGSRTYSNTVLIDESAQVKVFPNPVRDNLQLQGLQSGKTSVSIVDLQGNVRSSSVAGGANYSVNTSQLTPGNYLLKLQHNSTTTTQPFVKE